MIMSSKVDNIRVAVVDFVFKRAWLTFIVLCTSFGLFGAGTLNLFKMFGENWDLITAHGLMALQDGAMQQLLELLGTLFISMLNYIVFKACEHHLVTRYFGSSNH